MRRFVLLCSFVLFAGCSGDGTGQNANVPATPDAGPTSSIDAGAEPDCFEETTNHVEIINACTDAERVEKNPDLPLIQNDGKSSSAALVAWSWPRCRPGSLRRSPCIRPA